MSRYPRLFGSLGIVLVIVAILGLQNGTYVVPEGNQAIITQFGQFIRTDAEPGLYFKVPFYQNVAYFEKRIVVNDTAPAEYLTLDKKRIVIDPITRWRI